MEYTFNKSLAGLILITCLSRFILFYLINSFFSNDPSSDIEIYYYLSQNWKDALFYRDNLLDYSQYPYFLSILLLPGLFLDTLFYSNGMRIYFIAIDITATSLLLKKRNEFRSDAPPYIENLIYMFLLAPMSVIWCNEEIFSALVIILFYYFFQNTKGKNLLKIFLLSLSSIVFKVYFISASFYFLLKLLFDNLVSVKIKLCSFAVFSSFLTISLLMIGSSGYSPKNDFAISIWSILPYLGYSDYSVMYKYSFMIFLILSVSIIILSTWEKFTDNRTIFLGFFTVHIFCLTFYHVNPEYYIYPLLGYLLFGKSILKLIDFMWCYLVWFLSWVVNLLFYICSNFDVSWVYHNLMLVVFNLISVLLLINIFAKYFRFRKI